MATKAALGALVALGQDILGRSWGSFWPPGGHFFEVLGKFLLMLGPGPSKIVLLIVLCVFLYAVLVLVLIVSCFPRGDPGGYANIETSLKQTNVFR